MVPTFLADAIEPSLVPSPLIADGDCAVAFCWVLRPQPLPQLRVAIHREADPAFPPDYADNFLWQIFPLLNLLQGQIDFFRDARSWRHEFHGKVGTGCAVGGLDGLPGDDDVGAMSAYLLWVSLGLYPAIPGTPGFVLTAPMVDHAKLQLAEGRTLEISARGGRAGHGYIQAVELNGRPWTSSWLPLEQLMREKRNVLIVTLGPTPHPTWGTAMKDRPPSFGAVR